MFSPTVNFLSILMMVSLAVKKLFSLMYSHLFFFSFISLSWEIYWQKILLHEMSEILLSFLLRFVWFHDLHLSLLSHFVFILVYGSIRWWSIFIFFACISPIFPTPCVWTDCFDSIVCSCLLCQISIDHKGVSSFLGLCSVSFIYVTVIVPVPGCFEYNDFVV